MIRRLRDRLSYANVTATIALGIALGGTSYAAMTLPHNSVGAAQLRRGAVRSAEVKNGALKVRDLSARARSALRGKRGPAGPQGPSGTSSGSAGAIALTYKTVKGTVEAASVDSRSAICDSGQRVIGGGMRVDTGSDTSARESYPSIGNTAWTVRVGNDDEMNSGNYTVFAICTSG